MIEAFSLDVYFPTAIRLKIENIHYLSVSHFASDNSQSHLVATARSSFASYGATRRSELSTSHLNSLDLWKVGSYDPGCQLWEPQNNGPVKDQL